MLVRFLQFKAYVFLPPLLYCALWQKVTRHIPHIGLEKYTLFPEEHIIHIHDLNFICPRYLSILLYLFILSFQYKYEFCNLNCNHFFCCSVFSRYGHLELFVNSCFPVFLPHQCCMCVCVHLSKHFIFCHYNMF